MIEPKVRLHAERGVDGEPVNETDRVACHMRGSNGP